MDTVAEYAIFDNEGNQFGLPARSWSTKEQAESAMAFLMERREQMRREAAQLGPVTPKMSTFDIDKVVRWEKEAPRTYTILARQVTPWVPA